LKDGFIYLRAQYTRMAVERWTVEQHDGTWTVEGDRAPSHANADTLGFCLEIVAEEAERLRIPETATVYVENGRASWSASIKQVKQDYQV